MNKLLFLAVTLLISYSSYNQELCSVHQLKEIIDPETYQSVPKSFQVFNLVMDHFGEEDILTWDKKKKAYQVYYKGKLISDWSYNGVDEGKRFMLKYTQNGNHDNISVYFKSTIPLGNGKSLIYELNKKSPEDEVIVEKYYAEYGYRAGPYLEQSCDGNILIEGEYCLIDTMIKDTVTTFSPETYEEMVVVTEQHVFSHRSGKWKYFDENGRKLRKEKYRRSPKSKNKKMEKNKQPNKEGEISGQLIEKEFRNKGGKSSGFSELYLRCSVQDYFIKLCECEVNKKDLLPYLDKGISVKGDIIEFGEWDICPGDNRNMQSRIGTYIVIHKILD